ncbi:PEP-CTERM sorting domain-containing protein [Mucisphaera sp.]|uniref:PEP-CTERM sorting domain-containing protein n=1 Tax=Mucisphaera sp. TaxID=2913024 RepID=UPI003D138363
MQRNTTTLIAALALGTTALTTLATTPYTPVVIPPNAAPGIGAGVITPNLVFGKEYSSDIDTNTLGAGGLADPEQIIAWDGIGGTADGLDYTASRGPNFPREQQVDATANHNDALFRQLYNSADRTFPDRAHLIFSIDDTVARYVPAAGGPPLGILEQPSTVPLIPASGPVLLSNGNTIGGSGDISVEEAGAFAPPSTQRLWTPAPTVNNMPAPKDVDAVEVWGPEPAVTGDADKYSLDVDITTGNVSVWSYNQGTNTSTPYINHNLIVNAVQSLLGPVPSTASASNTPNFPGVEAINLDALMVRDIVGDIDTFDRTEDTNANIDAIIFSIRQIVDPFDPDGFYATGSELFVLDGTGFATYLEHGGHTWDHNYALNNLQIIGVPDDGLAYIDINAIEAIGEIVIPEPASAALLGLGALMLRRRKATA